MSVLYLAVADCVVLVITKCFIVHFRHLPLIPSLHCSHHVHPPHRCTGLCGPGGDHVYCTFQTPSFDTSLRCSHNVRPPPRRNGLCGPGGDHVLFYISDTFLCYLVFSSLTMSTLYLHVMDYVVLVVIMCFIVHFRHLPLILSLRCSHHVHPLPRCNGLCGPGGDHVFIVDFRQLSLIPCLRYSHHVHPLRDGLCGPGGDHVFIVHFRHLPLIPSLRCSHHVRPPPRCNGLCGLGGDHVFIVHFRHLPLIPSLRCSHHVHPPPRCNGLCGPGGDHVFYRTIQTPSFDTLPSLPPPCPPST